MKNEIGRFKLTEEDIQKLRSENHMDFSSYECGDLYVVCVKQQGELPDFHCILDSGEFYIPFNEKLSIFEKYFTQSSIETLYLVYDYKDKIQQHTILSEEMVSAIKNRDLLEVKRIMNEKQKIDKLIKILLQKIENNEKRTTEFIKKIRT